MSVACRLGGPRWNRRRAGESLPSRLVSDIVTDPCQRRVLLQRVGRQRGIEAHTGYSRFDASLFLFAVTRSLEKGAKDRVHPALVAWCACRAGMAKRRSDNVDTSFGIKCLYSMNLTFPLWAHNFSFFRIADTVPTIIAERRTTSSHHGCFVSCY